MKASEESTQEKNFIQRHPILISIVIMTIVSCGLFGLFGGFEYLLGYQGGRIKGMIGGAALGAFWVMIPTFNRIFD